MAENAIYIRLFQWKSTLNPFGKVSTRRVRGNIYDKKSFWILAYQEFPSSTYDTVHGADTKLYRFPFQLFCRPLRFCPVHIVIVLSRLTMLLSDAPPSASSMEPRCDRRVHWSSLVGASHISSAAVSTPSMMKRAKVIKQTANTARENAN